MKLVYVVVEVANECHNIPEFKDLGSFSTPGEALSSLPEYKEGVDWFKEYHVQVREA